MHKISKKCWLWQYNNNNTLLIYICNYLMAAFVHISHSPLGFWIFQVFSTDIGLVFVEHFKISPLFKTTNNFSKIKKTPPTCNMSSFYYNFFNLHLFRFTCMLMVQVDDGWVILKNDNQRKITLETKLSINESDKEYCVIWLLKKGIN